ILGHYVLSGDEHESAEREVGEPEPQERVGEDYGDPDQVQYPERHDAHPEGQEDEGQHHPVREDPRAPRQVLAEEPPPSQTGPRTAYAERDADEEQEKACCNVGEERPVPRGGLYVVPSQGVQIVGGVVDDHHDDGDASGRIYLPEPVPFALRIRLLSGFSGSYPTPAPAHRGAWVRIGP